jgi:hypothetical protein
MKIMHDFHDNNSLDFLILTDDTIFQGVVRQNCPVQQVAALRKEMTMHTNEHTTVWGTPIGIGRARDTKSWYQQLRDWWTAHKAARHEAKLAALTARWDAKREAVTPDRAEAAPEMAAAHQAISVATMLYGLNS